MISLGLDPSLTGFGWVVHDNSVVGPARVIAKGVFTTSASCLFVKRYMQMRARLVDLIESYPEIRVVGVESPPYGEGWSEGLYGLFLYVNEAIYLSRKDVVYFDPLTVKLLAKMDPGVRRGKMDKGDMVGAAKAETGIKRWSNDEADAYIIGRGAARFWELEYKELGDEELTPSERHSFTRVHTFKRGSKAGRTVRDGLIFRENDRFFRFSKLPIESDEEEFRSWLRRKGQQLRSQET
jgi:hypothetical protein